jgi:preprotein translocase YajC subunit
MSHVLLLLTTTTTQKTSSSSSWLLPLMIIGFGAIYFFVIRPRQKASQQQRQKGLELEIGDEVVTIGGVRGVVVGLDDETVTIATGQLPGDEPSSVGLTHITFIRRAIGQKVTPPAPDEEAPPTPEEDGGESDPEKS